MGRINNSFPSINSPFKEVKKEQQVPLPEFSIYVSNFHVHM